MNAVRQDNNVSKHWRRAVFAAGCAVGLLGATSEATAEGWYVELGIGQSRVTDFACRPRGFLPLTCNDDATDTGYSLHAGYWLNENVALEFGYTYLGFATADGTVNLPPTVSFNADFESWGYDVAVLGLWPVGNRVSLYGRAGIWRWTHEASAFVGGGVGFDSESESGTDPFYGFGAELDVNPRVRVRIQAERFLDVGGNETGQSDVDLLSVNLVLPLQNND